MTILKHRRIYFWMPQIQNDVKVSITLILRKCFWFKHQQNTKMHHITVAMTYKPAWISTIHMDGVLFYHILKSDVVPVARHFNASHSFNNQINANCHKQFFSGVTYTQCWEIFDFSITTPTNFTWKLLRQSLSPQYLCSCEKFLQRVLLAFVKYNERKQQ